MQYGSVSEADAHDLFIYLGTIDLKSGLVSAMKGERAMGLDLLERVRKNGFAGISSSSKRSSKRIPWLLNIRACADELFYLNYMQRPVDAVSQPINKTISQTNYKEPEIPKYAIMSSICIPIFAKCRTKQYEAMATIQGDRTFLAVLAYKSKFGSYPQDLQQVEKNLGWKLPLDPLGKGLFKYKREGKGFVIYGFGRNRKDDNASTVQDLKQNAPRSSDFAEKYSYTNGDGTSSADMIWRKDN